jgi:hypothetical protein
LDQPEGHAEDHHQQRHDPDQPPSRCAWCQAALAEANLTLANRFDKVDLPKVVPVVTRVERYAGHCCCCGTTSLAPQPEGLEPGMPFPWLRRTVQFEVRRGAARHPAEPPALSSCLVRGAPADLR